eukprot:Seg3171.3 transcript_id=Seg3171.3/GoldUCD/mRNA.D3Y31 product="Transmembrane prolyl 4-hydroxylase" protein_id=Seg3171.3/GoldUCD/D3Y31
MRFARITILVALCYVAKGEKSEKTDNKGCINVKETKDRTKIENKYTESANTKKEDVVEDITLPVPPKVRSSRGPSRLEILKSDANFLIPKYVRLPVVNGVKDGYEREIEFLPGENRTLRTLSLTPKVFEVEDFLDEEECDLLVELAKRKRMKPLIDRMIDSIIHGGPEKTFHAWDLNDDEFVDHEEMALVPGRNMKFTVEDASDMIFMLKMDANDDGKVDLAELVNTDLTKVKEYFDELYAMEERKREMTTENTWVWHDQDELLRFQEDYYYGYHSRIESLTMLPEELISESEPLQVQHYGEHQFTQCKRDSDEKTEQPCCLYGDSSDCRNCRFITMAIFLNDVEEGGELVFPMADHRYSDIMKSSGEWRGYFTYAKTTGSQNRFTANMKFTISGKNRLVAGEGRDTGGKFDITDGILIGDTVKFQKSYSSAQGKDADIKYSGKIISGSRILGNWYVPDKKRLFGTFFMWNKDYEMLLRTSTSKCNHNDFCTKSGLVVKPQKGKAVFWYNHETDYETGMVGPLDNDCLYGHCAVAKGDKWIATTRLNVIGDGEDDLRAWRRGTNWMQDFERYPNIVKRMGSLRSPTKLEEYKEDFERHRLEGIDNGNKTVDHKTEPHRKTPSHVLNAVNTLLNAVDLDGLKTIAGVVHKKLRLTCVPYYVEEGGKLTLKDGSKPN